MAQKAGSGVGLRIIAAGKLVKVIVLLTVGVLTLSLGQDPSSDLKHWADLLRLDPGNHFLHRALAAVSGTSRHRLHEISLGTFVYAALFAVEGVGLWMEKRWAEYLTIVITLSFVPLEIYELARHVSAGKVVMLLLNLAAVVYLAVRLRRERASKADIKLSFA